MDSLLLLSGNDIPFPKAQITIHNPTIREIAYIGEENFFTGYEILNISKKLLIEEDKNSLENKSNFDILIAILRERNAVMQKNRDCVQLVLMLLFPKYIIIFNDDNIEIQSEDNEQDKHFINNDNFEDFKIILNQIFNLIDNKSLKFNPQGSLAKKIADKLKKRHQYLANKNKKSESIDIISRYISILTVGLKKDMNSYFNYTFYQLIDEFKRFELKEGYDMYVKAKLAGAQDLKEVDEWTKNIHSK